MPGRALLLGRSGTGRTRRLLDRLAGLVGEGREEAAILLVPNVSQAGHLKRLLLSRHPDLVGFFDLSVLTFTGLAERVLPGPAIGDLLSGTRQDLLLRRALEGASGRAFGAASRYAGFRQAALALLKELKQNGLAGEELAGRLEKAAGEREGVARRRLLAFRDLLEAYEALREEQEALDHEDYLRLARDALRGGTCDLSPEFLGVDGFQNFTRLERELLLALVDRAAEAVVTLPWDPALEEEEGRQFRVSLDTLDFLSGRGFDREVLEGNRRARTEALRGLEAGLFGPAEGVVRDDGSVRVLEGADPEDEADRVARTVRGLVREGGRRYRDIVLVVRDIRAHGPGLRQAFLRHGLPLRVHGKEALSGRPWLRACRDLFRVAAGDVGPERVRSLLRADAFVAIDRVEVDRLEHELLLEGLPGDAEAWARRLAAWPDAAGLFQGIPAFSAPAAAAGLRERFLGLAARFLVPLWRRDPSGADEDRVRWEARSVQALERASSEVAEALQGEGVVPAARFLSELAEALRGAEASLPDRRLDVVNLIDAREARQWEAPVVFVCGLTEGAFPRRPREDLFLADRDREELNRSGTLSLRERLLERDEERYLFYVAATRARELLFLTRPATDGQGTETLASHFLLSALSLFAEEDRPRVVSARRLSDLLPREEEVAGREDLRRFALHGLGEPWRAGTPEARRSERAAALHDLLAAGDGPYLRALRVGLRFRGPIAAELADPGPLRRRLARGHSASSLGDFAQCPFLHFARRVLRLEAPPSEVGSVLDRPLLGEIAHEVLQRVMQPVVAGGDLDAEALEPLFDEVFSARTGGSRLDLAGELARRELLADLREVVLLEASRLAEGRFRPSLLEWDFDVVAGRDAAGSEVRLRGRVDRVDRGPGGAVVIDYKYSDHGFDKRARDGVREGTHFQLPVYLLAVRDALGEPPRGAWLYPLRRPRTSGYVVAGGPPADDGTPLDEEELASLLASTRDRALSLDARIRSGEVAVRPRHRRRCPGCEHRDLCRLEA